MTLAVVLLPDTALLVPGVAGRADPLADLRAAALAALAPGRSGAPDDGSADVLVLAPGHRDRRLDAARASFAAAGVPDRAVEPGLPGAAVGPGAASGPAGAPTEAPVADVPASVALTLLAAAGRRPAPVVVEIDRGAGDAAVLQERGRALAGTLGRDLLVLVVGSLSAREGVDAPLAADPRAAAVDAALLHALGSGPDALAAVLAAQDTALRPGPGGLDVSGRGPWLVLLGLLAARGSTGGASSAPGLRARLLASSTGTALGAHAVAAWGPETGAVRPAHPEAVR